MHGSERDYGGGRCPRYEAGGGRSVRSAPEPSSFGRTPSSSFALAVRFVRQPGRVRFGAVPSSFGRGALGVEFVRAHAVEFVRARSETANLLRIKHERNLNSVR